MVGAHVVLDQADDLILGAGARHVAAFAVDDLRHGRALTGSGGVDRLAVAHEAVRALVARQVLRNVRPGVITPARVLDGGWRTWIDDGRDVTDTPAAPRHTSFPVGDANGLRLTVDDLELALGRGATLVDARPRHLFLGDPGARGTGHIPGARARSYQELVDGATGLFQSPDAIRRLVIDAGIDPDDPPAEVITTCGIGVSATVALIALERAGIAVTGVYDGAWSEWTADEARPIAYGGHPHPVGT
jgi:rhodanese-related sulfurtransferase